MIKKILATCIVSACFAHLSLAQTFAPVIKAVPPIHGTGDYVATVVDPAYKKGSGPRVLIDEAHNNYQTMEDRFKGFADLLAADGARVAPGRAPFSAKLLAETDILVICNALNIKNANEKKTINKWMLPAPEAFTDEEIKAVNDWVRAGGSLLLIADHMPFPAAATKMGDAFGVVMGDNFAFDAAFTYKPGDMNLIKFYRHPPTARVGTLNPHSELNGRNDKERVSFVVSFTGNGFRMKPEVPFTPIMTLGDGTQIAWPIDHADISIKTPFSGGDGLYQGVILPVGNGRVAVFGEASMFSVNYAEWVDNYPTGFQNPDAPYNKQFVLNVFHWLSKLPN